ncbi:MAG: MBL fold metallo-hydrolase [Erythrobacter sp.]
MTNAPFLLTFHGAAQTVTGSCMEFRNGSSRILVDCGLFQGSRTIEKLNYELWPFDPARIDAVILTHAHIDHSGLLPKLVAQGFAGPVWCMQETIDLLEHMLADSGRIHEFEAERRNRRRDRAGEEPFVPLYTADDAMTAWRQCRAVSRETWFEPAPGFRARLWNAGHILGSASVELESAGRRVMCSGDIGPANKAFHPDPAGPSGFDHVICEATYGNRERTRISIEERRGLLEAEVLATKARGGNLVIPIFALERTQELLLDLSVLINTGRIPNTHVFVDSPLANRITSVFARYSCELEDTGQTNIFDNPAFHFVSDVAESMRLNSITGAVIMAASGMCEAGRIRHHLRHNLHRPRSTILFVGFQAQGTLGRVILEGAKVVRISGTDVKVRAQIRHIDTYSAHADMGELRDWIAARMPVSGTVFLNHGEPAAGAGLRETLHSELPDLDVRLPEIGEKYALPCGDKAQRKTTGRSDLTLKAGRDWQNDYADFATSLRSHLIAMHDDRQREQAMKRLRAALSSYQEMRGKHGHEN